MQIIFEATDKSSDYPLGVKVSHRAFISDDVKLLKKLPRHMCTHINEEAEAFANVLAPDGLTDAENDMRKLMEGGEFPGIIWDRDIENHDPETPDFVQQFSEADNVRIGTAEAEIDSRRSGAEEDEASWIFSLGYVPITFLSRTYPLQGQKTSKDKKHASS